MPVRAIVDNDILVKGSCYGLLEELLVSTGGAGSIGVLGSARFVVRDVLSRDERISDSEMARAYWDAFLPQCDELEPSPEEVDMATEFQEEATTQGVALDGGESLLCAIAIVRPVSALITGDKRAIEAIQGLLRVVSVLATLAGRVICLEQIVGALVARLGPAIVRAAICAEPRADLALSLVFQCARGEKGALDPAGLPSYVEDIRSRAPQVLAADPVPLVP